LYSELPKRPTSMQFTADGQIILVSDKFGDVFRRVRSPPLLLP
jgi:tRNA (guanine-N(7)-)-methyltransferase subunit TRM82